MTEATIDSPCIGVCAMDDTTGLCMGCYRTIDEIRGWWDLDNTAKQKIIDIVNERQQSAFD